MPGGRRTRPSAAGWLLWRVDYLERGRPVQGNSREHRLVMDEGYVELVLSAVEQIPRGQVASYGDIAELVGVAGPRLVGRVMSLHGAGVPWWRVVRADGRPVRGLEEQALELLRRDGTPLRDTRVDMRAARVRPSADPGGPDPTPGVVA